MKDSAFIFLMFANGLGIGVVADFLHKSRIELLTFNFAQMFNRRTSAAITPIPCYRFALLVCMLFVHSFGLSWCVGWWLFCIFCLALCVGKNANVPPKALAIVR